MDYSLLNYLEKFITENRKALFLSVLGQRTRHFTIVLENIYQQHNTSAVVRSCDIFGIQDLHVIENTYASKVSRRVARGAQKWLTFHRYNTNANNTMSCFQRLRKDRYQIIAATPNHHNSCSLHNFDFTKKSAFVFGTEKEGVSDSVMEYADGFLKIPMVGFTESLNISVAAAIILESVTIRLRNSKLDWKLSDEEMMSLYQEWIEKSIKNVDNIKEYYWKGKDTGK